MIGVGIAGAGWFAGQHARAIAAVPGVEIRAAVAGKTESTAAFVAEHGGTACGDWRAMLDDKAVDAILVATPHHLHTEIVLAAAQAGKHVLVEKPMAPTLAECEAMIAAATAAGTQLMVGQIMRYSLPCIAAHDFLATGALGRPLVGRSSMVKFWMEHNRRAWHLTPETGGGMMLTAGIHALDRLVWLMGAPVAAVAAMAGHLFHDQAAPDVDLVLLRFAKGALGEVTSVGNRDRTTWNTTELSCEGGTLELGFDHGVRVLRGGKSELLPNSAEPDWMHRALEREWREFEGAITRDSPLTAPGSVGAHLIACIDAACTAARERHEVRGSVTQGLRPWRGPGAAPLAFLAYCAGDAAPTRRSSPVDHQLGAGHVVAGVAGEEQHAVGNLLRLRGDAQRHGGCQSVRVEWRAEAAALPVAALSQMGVTMMPGWTELTRICSPASSSAMDLAR